MLRSSFSTSQPADPPQQVAQLRQQFEGLTPEHVQAAGYVPEGPCIPSPYGAGAIGTHAINQALYEAQFPTGTMDPTQPNVLLVDQDGGVIGLEWEAADVGQGLIQLFGQTIQLQSGHPGAEEPHYMLHIYFKPDGKVLFGVDDQTAFDPELSCPPMPDTGGIVSPLQLGGILFVLAGGLAVLGVAAGEDRLESHPGSRGAPSWHHTAPRSAPVRGGEGFAGRTEA